MRSFFSSASSPRTDRDPLRYSSALIPTSGAQAENLGASDSLGAALLHRGGYARSPSGRNPVFLPLGARVLANLEAIVRRQLDTLSAHEMAGAPWSPTSIGREAGEVLRSCSLSRKSLPIVTYQLRSPSALICALDETEAWADVSRARLEVCVRDILFRAGLPPAIAAGGDTGDYATDARLFWIVRAGSSKVEICFDRPGYAATSDVAPRVGRAAGSPSEASELESVLTPNIRTVRDVADHLGVRPSDIIKTIVVLVDGEPILAAVRGDRALSLSLLRRALPSGGRVQLAPAELVEKTIGCEPGFVGPIDSPLRVIADVELRGVSGLVCGAGEADTHLRGVDLERDAKVETWAPLGAAVRGDISPMSGEPYEWLPVDVLARVTSPGNRDAIDLGFTIASGRDPIVPIATTAAIDLVAIILAAADRHAEPTGGIAWPIELAPFAATISVLKITDEACSRAGDKIYRALKQAGVSVLLDDRASTAGAKLSDAALIGAPVRIAIGPRSIANREVEIRARFLEDSSACPASDAAEAALALLAEIRRKERSAWT